MPGFAWPLAFLLLPLPLVAARLLPRAAPTGAALRLPFYHRLEALGRRSTRPRTRLLIALCGWMLLVAAAARPQWPLANPPLAISGRNLVLAVDISGSMRTEDMRHGDRHQSRLAEVQAIAGEFLTRRRGDRVGLILFGSEPYLQVPLTFDLETTRQLLAEAEIGLAGTETALGDAIGLAVKRLRDSPGEAVLILLSDGAANTGVLRPLQAARLAAQVGLRIHTIGIGAEQLMVDSPFGRELIDPSADLDETTLRRIAELTGGLYFRARDGAELDTIYARLDQLEPTPSDDHLRPVRELYPWPLAGALLLSVLLALPKRRR
ncbi:MAG: VWA domain-containing protein [Candidatus Competibacterales bacterium]|nr:VWA domain-containing protein [Candidatus Competibacterales bacterium]